MLVLLSPGAGFIRPGAGDSLVAILFVVAKIRTSVIAREKLKCGTRQRVNAAWTVFSDLSAQPDC
jgi:hypothetical protein